MFVIIRMAHAIAIRMAHAIARGEDNTLANFPGCDE